MLSLRQQTIKHFPASDRPRVVGILDLDPGKRVRAGLGFADNSRFPAREPQAACRRRSLAAMAGDISPLLAANCAPVQGVTSGIHVDRLTCPRRCRATKPVFQKKSVQILR